MRYLSVCLAIMLTFMACGNPSEPDGRTAFTVFVENTTTEAVTVEVAAPDGDFRRTWTVEAKTNDSTSIAVVASRGTAPPQLDAVEVAVRGQHRNPFRQIVSLPVSDIHLVVRAGNVRLQTG